MDETVTVHFDIESREYNGRWYTNIRAWKVDKGATQVAAAAATQTGAINAPSFDGSPTASEGTDLPF
jgi:hypothetical protein